MIACVLPQEQWWYRVFQNLAQWNSSSSPDWNSHSPDCFNVPRHNLRKARKIRLKVKVIELSNDSWSWNDQLMSNIGHRSLFNQLLSNLLVDNTRNLVIFLDERSHSDHHFRAMIALESTLFQEDSSRYTSRFEVRNFRSLLKVIFLHLMSTIRTRWDVVVQFGDDFFMCVPINDKNFFKQSDFSIEVEWCQMALFLV